VDRQQIASILLCVGIVFGSGCKKDRQHGGVLELPTAAAVLHPEVGGPFDEPIAFVGNGHGGLITLLALKQGRFLSDSTTSSFLRTAPLATGRDRLIRSLAVYAPSDSRIDVYAGDNSFQQLVKVPYMVDKAADGSVVHAKTTVSAAVFIDADNSGDSPTLTRLTAHRGRATTEDWRVEYLGGAWLIRGTRSGRLSAAALPGLFYISDNGTLSFVISGGATEGDYFEFSTDNGVEEFDVGGSPIALAMAPDQSLLAMVVTNENGSVLSWLDPSTDTLTHQTALGEGASPYRLSWSEDGQTLWVADVGSPNLWEVPLNNPDVAIAHPLPWPIRDVAELDGVFGRNLYVAAANDESIWLYDPDALSLVDLNPWTEEVDGHWFPSPVMGIEAMRVPYRFPEADESSVHRFGRSVAVSLQAGGVVFLDEETGCLIRDAGGPRTQLQGSYGVSDDYETNFEGTGNAALLTENALESRHVIVNPCAGVAHTELWTLRYSQAEQAWEVDGSLVGPQQRLAYEDHRYLSDAGEVSFVVRAGMNPSEDGWMMQFRVFDGVLAAKGDNNNDNQRDVRMEVPGDPVYFHYQVGPDGDGWKKVDDRPFVLVLGQGSDIAGRVDPQTAAIEVSWE
jgi:hypothetical protein